MLIKAIHENKYILIVSEVQR